MASIFVKRLKKEDRYYVIQTYHDEEYEMIHSGKKPQHWHKCKNKEEADELLPLVQKAEDKGVIYKKPRYAKKKPLHYANTESSNGMKNQELIERYMEKKCRDGEWQARTAYSNRHLAENYIYPYIGDDTVDVVDTPYIQLYYQDLQNHPSIHPRDPENPNISARTIKEIHKILRPAFKYAVQLGVITVNPANEVSLPREKPFKRKQWTLEEVQEALRKCPDRELELIISFMCACVLRSGEILGLRWSDIELSEHDTIGKLNIRSELARLTFEDIRRTGTVIHFQFPNEVPNSKSALFLKEVKTERSDRDNYIPDYVLRRLLIQKAQDEEYKKNYKGAYQDFDLVFHQKNGRPYTDELMTKRFNKYVSFCSLKQVQLYSLRHSGATIQMAVSGNDIKAVQANMGHSTTEMLTRIYLSPVEEHRKEIARQLDAVVFEPLEAEKAHKAAEQDRNKQITPDSFWSLLQSLSEDQQKELFQKLESLTANPSNIDDDPLKNDAK
ncbi:MAG: tyrosine-type recombinase/integrase [Oscillospiraceae bacterium]|nr:tyrosine-type recombinase/integrase [Oscillospiraceae bacterium]